MLRIRSTAALVGIVPALAAGVVSPAPAHEHAPAKVSSSAKVASAVFRVAASSHYGQPTNASGYSVIAVTGHDDLWAFGGTNPGGLSAPVAAHWNGKVMAPSRLPTGLTGFISDASAPSPSDIWAASEYGRYIVHWNGHVWLVARRWPSGQITGLAALNAHDVWVFGAESRGSQNAQTWHFDGRSWAPAGGLSRTVYRASAVSPHDIWAITQTGSADPVLRFNGHRWRHVDTGNMLHAVQPQDILAISRRNVWVLGNTVAAHGSVHLVLAHWNGQKWTRFDSHLAAWAGRLAAGWHGSVLVTATPAAGSSTGLILEATAAGWHSVRRINSALGSGVSDVAVTNNGRSLWASGGILTRLGGDAAIWRDQSRPGRADDD